MFLQVMPFIYTGIGMLFLMLFGAHVIALLLKGHRSLIPSMFTGMISREYAEKHHPAWLKK
jgi:uncharacterized membrane protein